MKAVCRAALIVLFLTVTTRAQLVRQSNVTLQFPNSLRASGQYELVDLLPGLEFDRPVCVATPPGETNRLFVVERVGRIWVINDLNSPSKELFLDISARVHASAWDANDRRTEGLSSIAFHPNFASNHRFFCSYNTVTNTLQGDGHHNRVGEFLASEDNRQGLPNSEIPLITQYDEGDGHNINDLHFGPDGYLYIASGDEGDGGTGDDYNNAQKIDKDFFSAIMRIDVDKKPDNLTPNDHLASNTQAYKIPADNPYVGAALFNGLPVDPQKVRTEFFAVGLRNPWRFSFDPQTGAIYEGDVGQHAREEINKIVKGGNYGWSFKEGTLNGSKTNPPPGFTSIPPLWEYGTGYGPDQGFSVTGGVVYRGEGIPALAGSLIFADFESGNVWALKIDSQSGPPVRLTGSQGIAGFGYDPRNGDVIAVNHKLGRILSLRYSTGEPDNLPASLDQTGIFSDLATLTPNTGIESYEVNTPLWSDDALKRRWFSIPADKQIQFAASSNWVFPSGSVWVKHFEIQTKVGDPASVVRLETRVLVKTDGGLYGVTYKWNDSGTAATLVPENGDTRGLLINLGSTNRRQIWRFPSRSECLSCHTDAGGKILGFNTAQLNRNHGYGSVTNNQIAALASAGFFSNPPAHPYGLYALASVSDETSSRAYRVRSYLAANCGQCHQPGTGILAAWDARVTTPLSQATIIWGPLANSMGPDTKVVVPGDTNKSAILLRMRSTGADRMPPLGTAVVDTNAVRLISEWIAQDLPQFESYEAWASRYFSTIPGRDEDSDGDGASNFAEYLMNSDPTERTAGASFAFTRDGRGSVVFKNPPNRGIIIERSDDIPSDAWRVLENPFNKLVFPAQALDRALPVDIASPKGFYRMRVLEP